LELNCISTGAEGQDPSDVFSKKEKIMTNQKDQSEETLCEQELTYVTGGAGFVPVSGARLSEFGKKPLHTMSPIQEESVSGRMKTGKVVALGAGGLTISALTIGVGINQA
jgi:hypothetical protein